MRSKKKNHTVLDELQKKAVMEAVPTGADFDRWLGDRKSGGKSQ